MRKGRRLGVDVGDVRIGVAVCDPDGLIATPLETVAAGPNSVSRLVELAGEYRPIEFVIGLPTSLNGREGPAAVKVRGYVAELHAALESATTEVAQTGIRFFDERMTTMTAESQLRESKRSGKARRKVIDQAAATVILQTALDAERVRGQAPGETVKGHV